MEERNENAAHAAQTPEEPTMQQPPREEQETPHEAQMQGEPQATAQQQAQGPSTGRIVVEEFAVRGNQLLDTVQRVLRESSVRRIKIKNQEGRTLLDIPVLVAAVGSATAIVWLPILSALALLTGLFANLKVEVERVEPPEKPPMNRM
ncbi:MAG TPA: DUF4342 domain-containing protein [Candidatus Aquicultor sp.]